MQEAYNSFPQIRNPHNGTKTTTNPLNKIIWENVIR